MKSTSNRQLRMLARFGLSVAAAGILATACSSSAKTTSDAAGGSSGAASTGSSSGGTATVTVTNGHLTDASGRTVYLWLGDTGAASNCTGGCLAAWSPVMATGAPTAGRGAQASDLGRLPSGQVLYAGHPLYYYVRDKSAGDTNGQGSDGFGAKWWEVDATGHAITAGAPAASSSSGGGGGYGY